MCGRYVMVDIENLEERFLRDGKRPIKLKPNYNAAPTQEMPVITGDGVTKKLEVMRWGIPRMLGKDIRKDLFNTRSDKAFLPFWRKTVESHRCLVPANGFYEWLRTKSGKQPYYITFKQESLFAFAGIYDEWKDESGNVIKTYSIMTTEPNKEMNVIHNRMPVILHREDEDKWLSANDDNEIGNLLHPLEDHSLNVTRVSTAVNNARNNYPELLKAV